ncbi:hypothetical protein BJAS_P1408 [Bathymodiolus japonicus methanotrophic gill symbiont]|nr:hypothetical protein BJAS_P1408 [Bathymodiolus japonicus methanotrophic gill symbiont]
MGGLFKRVVTLITSLARRLMKYWQPPTRTLFATTNAFRVERILHTFIQTRQARHATSRNSGTPVAVIRSPTQRIGDAPAALRPPQTEHKAAQSWLPQMALRLFGIKF